MKRSYAKRNLRTYRRKRVTVRRTFARVPRNRVLSTIARSQVYPFTRFVNAKSSSTGSDAIPTGGIGISFKLSDVPSYTEFTALFDQYKIAGVAYRWVITTDPMVVTTKRFPVIKWVHDSDDATAPTLSEVVQYPRMREFWFTENKQCTPWYYIKPARSSLEYETAVLTAYRPQWKGFIDCASTESQHNAIKCFYDSLQTGVSLLLQCKYYMVFKNVR